MLVIFVERESDRIPGQWIFRDEPVNVRLLCLRKNSRDLAGGVVDDHHIKKTITIQVARGDHRDTRGKRERKDSGARHALSC
jgi:hypothetical protein